VFSRELPGKYTAKLLYGWNNKKYDWEYWKKIEENGKEIHFPDIVGICS